MTRSTSRLLSVTPAAETHELGDADGLGFFDVNVVDLAGEVIGLPHRGKPASRQSGPVSTQRPTLGEGMAAKTAS